MNYPLTVLATLACGSSLAIANPALTQKPTETPAKPSPTAQPSPAPQPVEPAAPTAEPAPTPRVLNQVQYKCDNGKGFQAKYFSNQTAETTFGSKVLTLNQIESGSGARYSDGSVTLYIKGNDAFVEVGSKRLFTNCVAQRSVIEGRW